MSCRRVLLFYETLQHAVIFQTKINEFHDFTKRWEDGLNKDATSVVSFLELKAYVGIWVWVALFGNGNFRATTEWRNECSPLQKYKKINKAVEWFELKILLTWEENFRTFNLEYCTNLGTIDIEIIRYLLHQ